MASQGSVFRCVGEGLPLCHNPQLRGDLFVKLSVHIPSAITLSPEQQDVLRNILGKATVQLPNSPHDNVVPRLRPLLHTALIANVSAFLATRCLAIREYLLDTACFLNGRRSTLRTCRTRA